MAAKQTQYVREVQGQQVPAYIASDSYAIIDEYGVALEDTLDAIYTAMDVQRPTPQQSS